MSKVKSKRQLGRKRDKSSGKVKERPWWAKSDAELVKDRYNRFKDIYDSYRINVDEEDRAELVSEAARRDPRIRNLLDFVIVKKVKTGRKREFLLVPVYETDRGQRIASFLRLRTMRRIRLDDYGWAVWSLIDGSRDVREMGARLRERFGGEVEPLYPRLSKFLAYLQNLKLIEIRKRED